MQPLKGAAPMWAWRVHVPPGDLRWPSARVARVVAFLWLITQTLLATYSPNLLEGRFPELRAEGAYLLTESATHSRSNAESVSRRLEGTMTRKKVAPEMFLVSPQILP